MSSEKNNDPMAAFDVVSKAEAGVKVPLHLPDGKETSHWLKVIGGDAPAFQKAILVKQRKELDLLKSDKPPEEKAEGKVKLQRDLAAKLVIGWSFEKECSHANVVAFFRRAPQIMEMVDVYADDRSNFFEKPSEGLEDSQDVSSG